MKPKKTRMGKSSTLEKALIALEAIVDHPQSVGLPDLADRLGMSRQSLHRLLQQLHEHGLVVKVPNRDRFAIGPRFSKLAINAICSANQGAPIRALIEEAVAELDETINVGVLAGRNFIYIERVECEREPRIYLETGIRLPAHVTSGGKAMMAFLSDKVRNRLVKTMSLIPFTKNTITDHDKLLEDLAISKQRGYSTANQEYADGIVGIGVPVLSEDGVALAALGLHAPVQRVDLNDAHIYAAKLQVAAARLAEIWDITD